MQEINLLLLFYAEITNSPPPGSFFRITEDGNSRITEDGNFRITES